MTESLEHHCHVFVLLFMYLPLNYNGSPLAALVQHIQMYQRLQYGRNLQNTEV